MMFDWNDQDQVCGGTVWGECNESEDHIVPYPKGTEGNTLFSFGDYSKEQKNEETGTIARSTEQTSGSKNDFPAFNLESKCTFNINEELSYPRPNMDTWPDLPALSAAFGNEYNGNSHQDSMETRLTNDFNEAPNLNGEGGKMTEYDYSSVVLQCKDASTQKGTCRFSTAGTLQLDNDPDMFNNGHEDKEHDNFLDCDWANIGDFDDLDRIFRNESIFGHDVVVDGDVFLSPSNDAISVTSQSIPMPDITLNRDQSSDHGRSIFQFPEHPGGKRKPEEKTADIFVGTGDHTVCQNFLMSEYQGTDNIFTKKVDKQKKLLRPQKKAEEKNKNKSSQNLNGAWSRNINHSLQSLSPNIQPSVTLPTFESPTIGQKRQVGVSEPMGHFSSYSQSMFSGYGYSTIHFPPFPLVPHIHAERNQIKPDAIDNKFYPDLSSHSNHLAEAPDLLSRPLTMTPQEKIEKLRRRQQMQAMLAIQQQQQQFGHQTIVTDNMLSQVCSQNSQDVIIKTIGVEENSNKLLSSELNVLVEHDECQISSLIDGSSLEETIYYQLQDALGKLDSRIRLCIRDSLFRLARSAVERQSASDRSSTNKSSRDEDELPADEAANDQNRYTRMPRMPDAETDTNPIDRTVAHLLFYRPLGGYARPVKEEIPQSPISSNPGPEMALVARRGKFDGQPENFEDMEVQLSV